MRRVLVGSPAVAAVTDLSGRPLRLLSSTILASNGLLHEPVREIVGIAGVGRASF